MEKTQSEIIKSRPMHIADTPVLELTRNFSAPVGDVWNAWSKPELIQQWWGPKNFTSAKNCMHRFFFR